MHLYQFLKRPWGILLQISEAQLHNIPTRPFMHITVCIQLAGTQSWELTKKRATVQRDCLFGNATQHYLQHYTINCINKWSHNIWQVLSDPGLPPIQPPFPRAYLSRLESGWEEVAWPPLLPLPPVPDELPPVPADCLFPDKSFSTAARFPVRAASRSSCSFPIADPGEKSEEARGEQRGKEGG